jgi:hypothetical protein
MKKKSSGKKKGKCSGPVGHKFRVSAIFYQNVVGIIRLQAVCLNCGKRFIVPVVREIDREVVSQGKRMRISRPARRSGKG